MDTEFLNKRKSYKGHTNTACALFSVEQICQILARIRLVNVQAEKIEKTNLIHDYNLKFLNIHSRLSTIEKNYPFKVIQYANILLIEKFYDRYCSNIKFPNNLLLLQYKEYWYLAQKVQKKRNIRLLERVCWDE